MKEDAVCTEGPHLFDLDVVQLDLIADHIASSSRGLADFERAFNRHVWNDIHGKRSHLLRWSRVFGMEFGVWLTTSTGESKPVPVEVLKSALRLRHVSRPLDGGWHDIKHHSLQRMLGFFDSSEHISQGQRLLFVHFDAHFGAEGSAAVADFRQQPGVAETTIYSTSVMCELFGVAVPLRLQIRLRPEWGVQQNGLEYWGPQSELSMGLDLDLVRLPCPGHANELRIIVALVSAQGQLSEFSSLRKFDATGYMQEYQQWHGLYKAQQIGNLVTFWPTAGGTFHVAELELYDGSDSSCVPAWSAMSWDFSKNRIGDSLRSAVWNSPTPGTDRVPLVHIPGNEHASKPFTAGVFSGAVALLRRGGGLGFAQKVSAARDGGAVGCIIYDGQKALSMDTWDGEDCMGLKFNDTVFADPGIPAVLVGKETAERLLAAVWTRSAYVRIRVDRSWETLSRLPHQYKETLLAVEEGNPIHVAVAFEHHRRHRR